MPIGDIQTLVLVARTRVLFVESDKTNEQVQGDFKLVILSTYDENSVTGPIRAGARAFILKRASYVDLLEGLRKLGLGEMFLRPEIPGRLLIRVQKEDVESRPAHSALEVLSPRELQVLHLLADGTTSKEIAGLLDLSEQTVRSYRKTMMRKLGVNNTARLTQFVQRRGDLVDPAHLDQ